VLLKEEIEKLYDSLGDIKPTEIQTLIKEKFNVNYSLSGVTRLLKRLGYPSRNPNFSHG
jgi:transposase